VSLDKLVETRIQDAVAEGAYNGLKGAGKPFRFDPADSLAGDNWMGFKVLKNGGMLPPWLMLAREIEVDHERLLRAGERHDEWVAAVAESGAWERNAAAIHRLRGRLVQLARELRAKQDRFNNDAPSVALERPGIWVEHFIAQHDAKLRAAGAPERLFPWLAQPAGA
jgi:hypothetical protein